MDQRTQGERVLDALRQLSQFHLVDGDAVVHALTGAMVTAAADPDDAGHGMLAVAFPGGKPFQVVGPMYLDLMAVEHARLAADGPDDGDSDVSRSAAHTLEHLRRKHGID